MLLRAAVEVALLEEVEAGQLLVQEVGIPAVKSSCQYGLYVNKKVISHREFHTLHIGFVRLVIPFVEP